MDILLPSPLCIRRNREFPFTFEVKGGLSSSALSAGAFIPYKPTKKYLDLTSAHRTPGHSIIQGARGAQREEEPEKKTNKTPGKDKM